MRNPRDIIGEDAYMQLIFEGYEVVPAKTVAGFPVVQDQAIEHGTIQFRDASGNVLLTVFSLES